MESIVNISPIYLGIILFSIVLLMAVIRNIESRRISSRFSSNEIRLVSFGVTWFGQENKINKPLRKTGAIALVSNGVYFHSRFGKVDFFLPLNSIKTIGTTDFFCDKPLNDTVVQISFKDENLELDRVAFKIPSPARWIALLRNSLNN